MCKKIFALCLAAIMVCSLFALAGCKGGDTTNTTDATKSTDGGAAKVDYSKIKIGFIFLHDDKSTYDLNFMNAAKAAQEKLGLSDDQVIFKYPVDDPPLAMTLRLTLQTRVATSFSRTASVMNPSFFRQQKNSPMFSSATQPEPKRTPKKSQTTTTLSHPSMRVVILQVSPQV